MGIRGMPDSRGFSSQKLPCRLGARDAAIRGLRGIFVKHEASIGLGPEVSAQVNLAAVGMIEEVPIAAAHFQEHGCFEPAAEIRPRARLEGGYQARVDDMQLLGVVGLLA